MSISASYVILAVVLLRLLLKKAPKWISVVLWGLVAVRLVLPASLPNPFSLIPGTETVPPQIMTDPTPSIQSGIPALNNTLNPFIEQVFTPAPGASVNPLQIWIPILARIWVADVAGMLLYTLFSYFRIKGYQSRRVGVVENGTWAPTAGKTICSMLQQMKNINVVSPILTIRSAWKEDYQQDLEALISELLKTHNNI